MDLGLDDLPPAELRFHFKAGRLCLDFVATVGERWRRSFERLRTPDDLSRWFVASSLLSAAPPVSAEELDWARALREAIYRTAKLGGGDDDDDDVDAARGWPAPADVELINHTAAHPPLEPRLGPDGRATSWTASRPVAAALSAVARDAIDLLGGPQAARVRECAAPDCALLFLDSSRPGRRRWCSMAACGNRAKTKTYRRRGRDRGRDGDRQES